MLEVLDMTCVSTDGREAVAVFSVWSDAKQTAVDVTVQYRIGRPCFDSVASSDPVLVDLVRTSHECLDDVREAVLAQRDVLRSKN